VRWRNALKDQLESQRDGANSSGEEMRVQEVRIKRQGVALSRSGGGDAGGAEDIAVAKGVVGMVENVEEIGFQLQILRFGKVYVFGHRQVEGRKSGGSDTVAPQVGLRATVLVRYRSPATI